VSAREHLTSPGATLGNRRFTCHPEQVRAKELDALEVICSPSERVLYEMVNRGPLPFRGESSGVIFQSNSGRDSQLPAVRLKSRCASPNWNESSNKGSGEKDRNLRYQGRSRHAETDFATAGSGTFESGRSAAAQARAPLGVPEAPCGSACEALEKLLFPNPNRRPCSLAGGPFTIVRMISFLGVRLKMGGWRDRLFFAPSISAHSGAGRCCCRLRNLVERFQDRKYFSDRHDRCTHYGARGKLGGQRGDSRGNTIMQFKRSKKQLQEIARELTVDAIFGRYG